MSLKKYKKVKYLGKGSYGAAILVHLRSNKNETFVIKEIVIGHMKEEERESTMNEVEVLRQMHHSNIAMYVESFIEGSRLYIVMEHADGGDLSGSISRRKEGGKRWPENEVMRMFVQICLALKHVHEQNILHRDLKSQNIFLTSKGIVKLGDFGIAKVLDGTDAQARTQIGTPYYLSPEICESKPYGRSSDMWSLGVVLFELLALELPFTAQSLPALVIKICTADPKWELVEDTYSAPLVELCQNLLLKDCNSRPTVRELLKSDYLMAHISKLLSHTIKMGKGGAEGAVLGGANVDEVDRNIERERSRQKQNEKVEKENEKLAARHAQYEQERDKLRKFKQDKARQKKAAASVQGDQDDVVYVPPVRAGTIKPEAVERSSSERSVDEALAQAARREEARLREQQEQYERMLHEQQVKHEEELRRKQRNDDRDREREKELARAEAVPPRSRPGSGSNRSSRPASGESRLDCDRDQRHSRHSSHDRQEPQGQGRGGQNRQQDGYMVVAKPNGSEGAEEMSAARREFFANRAAAQQIKAKVEAYERGGSKRGARGGRHEGSGMEVALGWPGDQHHSQYQGRRGHGQGGQLGYEHQSSHVDEGRALTGEERIAQVKAQRRHEQEREKAEKERQLQQAYEETRRERMRIEALRRSNDELPSRDVNDDGGSYRDHECETSHYDRQRKKELQREEENRKHEQLLREARAPCRRKSNEGAVAFSIDFHDDSGNAGGVITVKNDKQSGKNKSHESQDGPSDQFRSRSNSEISESETSTSTAATAPRQRKSWGAPIAPPRRQLGLDDTDEVCEVPDGTAVRKLHGTDVALEVEEDEEAVLKCLEARNGREEAARVHAKEVFRKLREQKRREARLLSGAKSSKKTPERSDLRPPTRPPPGKSGDTPPRIPRKKSNTRLHDKPVNSDLPSLTNEREKVMKRGSPDGYDQENPVGGDAVLNDESVRRSRDTSPSSNLARLNVVMGQVAKAQEEVAKVIADSRDGSNRVGPRGSRGSSEGLDKVEPPSTPPRDGSEDFNAGKSTSSTQKTTVRNSYGRTGQRLSLGDDEIFAYSSGEDSDEAANYERELEKTLDSWLSKETLKSKKSERNLMKSMKKGDSMRSVKSGSMKDVALSESAKAGRESSSDALTKGGKYKDSAEAKYSPRVDAPAPGASMKSVRDNLDVDGNIDEEYDEVGDEDDIEGDIEDDEEEEDGEVAGLQCLLAKALLSENDTHTKRSSSSRDDISL